MVLPFECARIRRDLEAGISLRAANNAVVRVLFLSVLVFSCNPHPRGQRSSHRKGISTRAGGGLRTASVPSLISNNPTLDIFSLPHRVAFSALMAPSSKRWKRSQTEPFGTMRLIRLWPDVAIRLVDDARSRVASVEGPQSYSLSFRPPLRYRFSHERHGRGPRRPGCTTPLFKTYSRFLFLASQASDVGSIPIAGSINHAVGFTGRGASD